MINTVHPRVKYIILKQGKLVPLIVLGTEMKTGNYPTLRTSSKVPCKSYGMIKIMAAKEEDRKVIIIIQMENSANRDP